MKKMDNANLDVDVSRSFKAVILISSCSADNVLITVKNVDNFLGSQASVV